MANVSCGIMPYKIDNGKIKVFLCHPGGPYFKNMNKNWCIAKGHVEEGENYRVAAEREFEEETGQTVKIKDDLFHMVMSKSKKYVGCFFVNVNSIDPDKCYSNTFKIKTKTGAEIEAPEINAWKWFDIKDAYKYIEKYQEPLLLFLEDTIKYMY